MKEEKTKSAKRKGGKKEKEKEKKAPRLPHPRPPQPKEKKKGLTPRSPHLYVLGKVLWGGHSQNKGPLEAEPM